MAATRLAVDMPVHMAGKNWFLDRMVWHYEDATPEQTAAPASDRLPVSRADEVGPR
jgi:hypothetical protein